MKQARSHAVAVGTSTQAVGSVQSGSDWENNKPLE